jgi:hypothetical protein
MMQTRFANLRFAVAKKQQPNDWLHIISPNATDIFQRLVWFRRLTSKK